MGPAGRHAGPVAVSLRAPRQGGQRHRGGGDGAVGGSGTRCRRPSSSRCPMSPTQRLRCRCRRPSGSGVPMSPTRPGVAPKAPRGRPVLPVRREYSRVPSSGSMIHAVGVQPLIWGRRAPPRNYGVTGPFGPQPAATTARWHGRRRRRRGPAEVVADLLAHRQQLSRPASSGQIGGQFGIGATHPPVLPTAESTRHRPKVDLPPCGWSSFSRSPGPRWRSRRRAAAQRRRAIR